MDDYEVTMGYRFSVNPYRRLKKNMRTWTPSSRDGGRVGESHEAFWNLRAGVGQIWWNDWWMGFQLLIQLQVLACLRSDKWIDVNSNECLGWHHPPFWKTSYSPRPHGCSYLPTDLPNAGRIHHAMCSWYRHWSPSLLEDTYDANECEAAWKKLNAGSTRPKV